MEARISSLAEFAPSRRVVVAEEARRVFWETASQTAFLGPEEQTAFERKYFGYYREAAPEFFLVALSVPGKRTVSAESPESLEVHGGAASVLGYICGVADTLSHPELRRIAGHIPVFDDLYPRYPAHLHINLTAGSRGMGLGGRLLAALEERVAARGAAGIHLVTDPGARNVSFYRRNGYGDAHTRGGMLFLGKCLG